MFIRVKDPSTGHEFDVPETSPLLACGVVQQVKRGDKWPPSALPRPPKYAALRPPFEAEQPSPPGPAQPTEQEESHG